MKTGVELIAEERQRQVKEEGYTPEHDSLHDGGEIALSAACYAAYPLEIFKKLEYDMQVHFKQLIPFDQYKIDESKSEIRRMIIAGALIAAEIDRLQAIDKTTLK
jgi:hypothetical protein